MENEKLNQEALKKAESVISKWSWKNGIAWSPEALMAAIQAYLAAVPQPNDADVVEVIKAAIWANSTPDDCSIEAVEKAMGEAAQAALKALSDNGYKITKIGE